MTDYTRCMSTLCTLSDGLNMFNAEACLYLSANSCLPVAGASNSLNYVWTKLQSCCTSSTPRISNVVQFSRFAELLWSVATWLGCSCCMVELVCCWVPSGYAIAHWLACVRSSSCSLQFPFQVWAQPAGRMA